MLVGYQILLVYDKMLKVLRLKYSIKNNQNMSNNPNRMVNNANLADLLIKSDNINYFIFFSFVFCILKGDN